MSVVFSWLSSFPLGDLDLELGLDAADGDEELRRFLSDALDADLDELDADLDLERLLLDPLDLLSLFLLSDEELLLDDLLSEFSLGFPLSLLLCALSLLLFLGDLMELMLAVWDLGLFPEARNFLGFAGGSRLGFSRFL